MLETGVERSGVLIEAGWMLETGVERGGVLIEAAFVAARLS